MVTTFVTDSKFLQLHHLKCNTCNVDPATLAVHTAWLLIEFKPFKAVIQEQGQACRLLN